MSKKQKKDKAARSTRQLMGIEEIKDYCIATRMGNLVFFIIKPTNISVLPDSSISARIYALLNVVKGQAEIEMLALNSKESFERNKDFYRERLSQEELPAVRRLLEQDSKHLDRIQVLMASSREFYIIIRLSGEQEFTIIDKSTKRIGTVGINPSDFPFNFYLFICCPDDRYQCVHHLPLVLKADILPVIQIPGNAFHLLHRHSVRREFCNLIGNGLPPCVQLLNFAVGIGEQNRACARQRVKQLFNLAFHLRQFQPLCRQLRGDFRRIFPACQRLKIF